MTVERAVDEVRKQIEGEAGFGLIEVLMAAIVLAFGLLAVAGLSMTTASHERLSRWQTDQAMAAQLVLARAYQQDFDNVSSGSAHVEVGEHSYHVTLTVTDISSRVKQVDANVAGVGPLDPRTFSTRLYAPRQLPDPGGSSGGGGSGGGSDSGDDGGDNGGDDGGDSGDDDECVLPNGKRKKGCP